MGRRSRKRPALLSATRPPLKQTKVPLSSEKAREIVSTHHVLQKQLCAAQRRGDSLAIAAIQEQLVAAGGLKKYQAASTQGQAPERGGDSSKVLVQWMQALQRDSTFANDHDEPQEVCPRLLRATPLRMLEVGALRVDNACAQCSLFEVERIDLNAQHALIKQQDFMKRPLPQDLETDGFDVISLSLVLNFVPDAVQRGEMLRRLAQFVRLRRNKSIENFSASSLPALFFCLPSACVLNSRYMDEKRLNAIFASLGWTQIKRKITARLVYYLYAYHAVENRAAQVFRKELVRTGTARNNFAIILE